MNADKNLIVRTATCGCGQVQLQATGDPILTGVCYCDDCRAGGKQIESLPNAKPALDGDGGASYLTYRDDRFKIVTGEILLKGYKLHDRSRTTRYVATCCNSAMYLKFAPGHWVSTFRNRYSGELPEIEMRTQTQFRQSDDPLPNDAPTYRKFPISLFVKLIRARIAMLFS